MLDAYIYSVDPYLNGMRIDSFVTAVNPELSRNSVQQLINGGAITVDGKLVSKSYKVKTGETVRILPRQLQTPDILPENIPLDVRFEDDDLLVVNKPKGMVVHPAAGHCSSTLVNALMYHCGNSLSGINGVARPGIVHRIDKDTSGLLIVAKNDFAHIRLAEQIKAHSFARRYQTVVYGHMKEQSGTIDAPIGRHSVDRKKMTVTDRNGKNAVTHYNVVAEFEKFSHLNVQLETGRTHQIRVHMSYIGHPVAGDSVYGPKKCIESLNGQCLHAGYIRFRHPRNFNYIEVQAELPEYFESFLKKLRNGNE